MKKIILMAAVIAVGFTSCNKKTEGEANANDTLSTMDTTDHAVIDESTSQIAVDWAGTYKGVLPCADCEGIETVVVLNSDDTFSISQKYLGKDSTIEDKGTIMWHDGTIAHLKGKTIDVKFKVGENQLFFLDQEGKVIDGALKDKYILNKN